MITSPTWFSRLYATEKLAWYVYDLSSILRISLLPLLAIFLIKNKPLKMVVGAYFILTLTNPITLTANYSEIVKNYMLQTQEGFLLFNFAELIKSWAMQIQIGIASIILLFVIFKMRWSK